jgi:hypothetical protein
MKERYKSEEQSSRKQKISKEETSKINKKETKE